MNNKVYIVVEAERDGAGGLVCTSGSTSGMEPAVYGDSPAAEYRCAELRETFPQNRYAVVECYPL